MTLTLPNNTVTITGPPITISGPPVTITAPPGLATRTVTVRVHPHRPRKTVYIHVPGPVRTVYVIQPGHTVTVRPHNTVVTHMVTITSHPTRQAGDVHGTVSPAPEPEVVTQVRTKTQVIVRKILLSALVSIVLTILGILALYIGYILGQRDAQKYDNRILKGLISRARGEHKHFSEEEIE